MFHEDVVQVVRKRLELEDHLSEAQRPTALARSYYLKVLYNLIFISFFYEKKCWYGNFLLFYFKTFFFSCRGFFSIKEGIIYVLQIM